MAGRNFIVAGDRAAIIANDLSDPHYLGAMHYVPVGVQVPARTNDAAETIFFVERGTLEFMVGGPSGFVAKGGFVRVPVGVPFSYRNAGHETARLLVRTEGPKDRRPLRRITLEFAA
ncbi:MAG TPA: cupin domain-containing protein [Devosia sp.]|nr:cupin domain-containing protein [Devosia sp.]